MQNSNLTPEEVAQEAKDITNFRSGIFKLSCTYANHVADCADHNTGESLHPYLIVEREEISIIVQAYNEADMRMIFRPE